MASSDTRSAVGTLPHSLDRLIGRELELEAAEGQFLRGGERLFTVLGPGGVGKTRFALELAARLEFHFAGGGVWIGCADLCNPEEIERRLAAELGVRAGAGLPFALERTLRDCRSLLLLDNLEQISNLGERLSRWLQLSPHLCILTTSRRALRIPGERRFALAPLERPPTHAKTSSDAILSSSAVRLFLERTRAVRPDYVPPNEHLPLLAQLCENLDGLPLALEIAAAQMTLFELPALLEASRQPQTLSWSGEGRPLRQRSLEHNLMWSYTLLGREAQFLLGVLGALRGGFLKETALALAARLRAEGSWIDTLEELLESNWLRREGERFFLLESVRSFARALLIQTSSLFEVETALWEHYRTWSPQVLADFGGQRERDSRGKLALEWINLRSALEWAIKTDHLQQAADGLIALFGRLIGSGRSADALALLKAVLAANFVSTVLEPEKLALVLSYAGRVCGELGHFQSAQRYLERIDALPKHQLSATIQANLQSEIGNLHLRQGHLASARSAFERAFGLYQTLNLPKGMSSASWSLGQVRYSEQNFAEAEHYFERFYALQQQACGEANVSPWNQAMTLFSLSMAKRAQREPTQALVLLGQALEVCQSIGHWRNIAYTLGNIGLVQLELGHRVQAATTFAELERVVQDHALAAEGMDFALALALFDLAERRPERVRERIFAVLESLDTCDAQATTPDLALPLHLLAAAQAQSGQLESAALLLGAAQRSYPLGVVPFDYDGEAVLRDLERELETALGGRFSELCAQGHSIGHLPLLAELGLMLRPRLPDFADTVQARPATVTALSTREQSVLEGMARGETNRQMAAQLELSHNTVRSYSVSLFNKLGCRTRAQAVALGKDLGLL